jgi:uncharacterized small protein (DUF1192 family)
MGRIVLVFLKLLRVVVAALVELQVHRLVMGVLAVVALILQLRAEQEQLVREIMVVPEQVVAVLGVAVVEERVALEEIERLLAVVAVMAPEGWAAMALNGLLLLELIMLAVAVAVALLTTLIGVRVVLEDLAVVAMVGGGIQLHQTRELDPVETEMQIKVVVAVAAMDQAAIPGVTVATEVQVL